jgi:serine/threonine protein kinase
MQEAVGVGAGDALGGYRLEALLGEGAVGIVFRARSLSTGAPVALKVLRPELAQDELYVRRFRREADVAARVRHPALVPVVEAAAQDGIHFLVSEYVPGRTLARRLDDGPLSAAEVRRLARDLGGALDALAAAGLVHRDVKPANVLLDADDAARLTDFGLARGAALTILTRPGEILGTIGYIAPELVEGAEATPSSDLYSLGCVLYECLAGAPPFPGPKVFEVLLGHVTRDPPDPLAGRNDVPAGVGQAVLAALAKAPIERPVTGRMVATMLATRSG